MLYGRVWDGGGNSGSLRDTIREVAVQELYGNGYQIISLTDEGRGLGVTETCFAIRYGDRMSLDRVPGGWVSGRLGFEGLSWKSCSTMATACRRSMYQRPSPPYWPFLTLASATTSPRTVESGSAGTGRSAITLLQPEGRRTSVSKSSPRRRTGLQWPLSEQNGLFKLTPRAGDLLRFGLRGASLSVGLHHFPCRLAVERESPRRPSAGA